MPLRFADRHCRVQASLPKPVTRTLKTGYITDKTDTGHKRSVFSYSHDIGAERPPFVPPEAIEFPDKVAELAWKAFEENLGDIPEMFRARRNVVAIVKVCVSKCLVCHMMGNALGG